MILIAPFTTTETDHKIFPTLIALHSRPRCPLLSSLTTSSAVWTSTNGMNMKLCFCSPYIAFHNSDGLMPTWVLGQISHT